MSTTPRGIRTLAAVEPSSHHSQENTMTGFAPIRLEDYVEMRLRSNPGVERADLVRRLERAMDASKRGVRCQCGAPILIIGSAEVGLSCFSCITGESQPDKDYEISGCENTNDGPANGSQPIRSETNRTSLAAGSCR